MFYIVGKHTERNREREREKRIYFSLVRFGDSN